MAIMREQSPWHLRAVASPAVDPPILDSPFAEPPRNWAFYENGILIGTPAHSRRHSAFIVPIPLPKHKVKAQATLDLEDKCGKRQPTDYMITAKITQWRCVDDQGLHPILLATLVGCSVCLRAHG